MAGNIHQWKDENGNIHFGDKPPANVEADQVEIKVFTYTSPEISTLSDPSLKTSRKKVVIYTTEWCGYCDKAKQYFRKNNIRFRERDIEKSQQANRDHKKLGGKGVPLTVIGEKVIKGFSEGSFEKALNGEG